MTQITFLGTGTSHGVPPLDCMLGSASEPCRKGVCKKSQTDRKHRRTRTSVMFEKNGQTLLCDVSSDFREQALRERIMKISAVVLTHGHIDHFGGLPDIRSYTEASPLDMYASAETLDTVKRAFPYMFENRVKGVPRLKVFELFEKTNIAGFDVTPVPVVHGEVAGCFGLRIDNVGYVPDVKIMPQESKQLLMNLDCLILNCLRDEREHRTHMLLHESMKLARELSPKICFFIHMTHDIDYETDGKLLDSNMQFSYDGLVVKV